MNIEDKELIKQVVSEAVHETLTTLGFETGKPHEMQADQLYLRKMRKGSQDVNIFIRRSAIWAFICGAAYLMFVGLKAYLFEGKGS